jgi:acetate kinase
MASRLVLAQGRVTSMYILVVNSGSSSIKFSLFGSDAERPVASGVISRIGEPEPHFEFSSIKGRYRRDVDCPTHAEALTKLLAALQDTETGVVASLREIQAVGHRVVHGGSVIRESVLIDDAVIGQIRDCIPFAPLHNPANLTGILECRRILPNTPQVAVLDTSFHQTMPPVAYMYAIPYEMYERHGARRYGFHGTSFRFVAGRTARHLGRAPEGLRMVICHLGNGSSVAAVKHGQSLDTSMGMTPMEGLMMGTRSGDIDPGLVFSMAMGEAFSGAGEMERILNHQSGILGISGVSNDVRDISAHAAAGHARCRLALDMYAYRVRKYVGAYAAAMGGIDLLAFTAGIGENSAEIRSGVCDGLEFLGIRIDPELNRATHGMEADVSRTDSTVRVLVVPTNEEAIIAQDTVMLTRDAAPAASTDSGSVERKGSSAARIGHLRRRRRGVG